jgi:mono/diheme cytochrome c family protein
MDSLGLATYSSCATCHQANGEGVAGLLSPLAGSEIVLGEPEIPVAIILHGVKGPLTVKGTVYRGLMISWGGTLDDVQIAALATYIRSQWGNAAPAVTPELVAKVRAATASRTTMWSWDELQAASF